MERTTPPFVRRQKNPLTKSFCFPGISLLPSPAIISGTGGVFKEPFHEIARKGPPARPQVVEQQSSGLAVSGSQQGKPSAPVGMTSVVHDGMPVIHDPDGYDQ